MANHGKRRTTTVEAKRLALQALADGLSVRDAMASAQRSHSSYEAWRKTDPEFKQRVSDIRANHKIYRDGEDRAEYVGDFPSFSERYLHTKVFPHNQNMIDVIEGREPSHLHPAMKYEPGLPNYVLVNVPPEHAKSMTVSINYSTYRIAKDPNIRIMLVSKSQGLAMDFLGAIKHRLTHPRYQDLQLKFAPDGGFKEGSVAWSQNRIELGAALRDSGEKDPTVQALGIGGHIYGTRADIIILDDCVTLTNANEYEKQIRWIQQEVLTRLNPGGLLLILGTRVDTVDLYSEIVDPERYPDLRNPYTVLRMPAVLEFAEDPKDWVTLWPKADSPWSEFEADLVDENGLYPRWDGPHLKTRRGVLDPKTWAMVYQQEDIPEDAVFNHHLVKRAVNGMRSAGPMRKATPGHRTEGMDGLYVICSMDPAVAGDAGAVALAVDRAKQFRFVLDAERIVSPTPKGLRDLIERWTHEYKPQEWRIEKNAFQKFLTQDEALRKFLASQGVALHEHYTGKNKWDADWGVASMAPLFGYGVLDDRGKPTEVGGQLIELASTKSREGMKALVEQLVTWSPATKNKQDMVMALWFAEIRAKELCRDQGSSWGGSFMQNEFLSPDRQRRRVVVDINDYQQRQQRRYITA